MKPLWKTTIVVWSDFNPAEEELDASDLVRDGEMGSSHISVQDTRLVEHPEQDDEWDGTEFFSLDDDDQWPDVEREEE